VSQYPTVIIFKNNNNVEKLEKPTTDQIKEAIEKELGEEW